MTRAELRSQIRFNIFSDGNDAAPVDSRIDTIINMAMHHVANWARAVNPEILIAENTYDVQTPDALGISIATTSQFYTVVKKIKFAKRTTADADTDPFLEIVEWESIQFRSETAAQKNPVCFVHNDAIGFYNADDEIEVIASVYHGLPDMTADADTPGEAGGSGTANKLPLEYHSMIASWAAYLILTGENGSNVKEWREIFDLEQAQLLQSLSNASRTPEKG